MSGESNAHLAAPAERPSSNAPRAPVSDLRLAGQTGAHYGRLGLRTLAFAPWMYARLLSVFALPAATAALISAAGLPEGPGKATGLFVLNAISATLAPVIVMMAVSAGSRWVNLGVGGSLRSGARWLPRYLWTNLHTTPIFWLPIAGVVALMNWQRGALPLQGAADVLTAIGWGALLLALGVYLHTRTLLAPFYGVHANLPGTLATLESWRISGRYFWQVFGTFVVTAAPPAVIPVAIYGGLLIAFRESPERIATLLAMTHSLIWIGIKLVRPFLVAAVYSLHRDLWETESRRRDLEGWPPTPRLARALLALSGWLPRLGGRLIGRRITATL